MKNSILVVLALTTMLLSLASTNSFAQKALVLTSLKNFKSQSYKLNSKVHYKSKEHPHGNKGTIRYIFKESFRLKDGTVIPVVDVISIKSQSKLSQVFQIAGAQWVLVGGLAVLAGKSITGTLDNNALYIGSGILLVGSIPFVFRKNNHKIGSKWKLQIR